MNRSRSINKEMLKLALPSILANITVPLVGMVDIAVAGHISSAATGVSHIESATLIGGIAIGTMIFDLLYWNFGFLRVGTGGLTAQAYGRADFKECRDIFTRAIGIALASAFTFILLQWFIVQFAFLFIECSPEVKALASKYFYIRILAAPATLSLMAFKGWFIGMQDSVSPMVTDLVVNLVNAVASIIMALGIGSWNGIGFAGIAWGTVIAQYSGLISALLIFSIKYWKKTYSGVSPKEFANAFKGEGTSKFFTMNIDLVVRSLSFIGIYIGFTLIAARFGDLLLAVSSIMMKLLLLFSYVTDGFAYAGEAMTGKYIGKQDRAGLRSTVKYTFLWSAGICIVFMAIYKFCGEWLLELMTSDRNVIEACAPYMVWLFFMPLTGCAAFTWDGIFLGATASKEARNSTLFATIGFLATYFISAAIIHPSNVTAVHLLLAAYFVHLLIRSLTLTICYRKAVLSRVP